MTTMYEILLTCELTHAFVGRIEDGECKCGRHRIQMVIPFEGKRDDLMYVIGHNVPGLCPGPWIHNKEIMLEDPLLAKSYVPLPCFDLFCNKCWEEVNGAKKVFDQ